MKSNATTTGRRYVVKILATLVLLLTMTMPVVTQNPGTIDADEEAIAFMSGGVGTVGVQIVGTYSGTLEFEGTIDGTNWVSVRAVPTTSTTATTSTTSTGVWTIATAGMLQIRVRASALASGSVVVTMNTHIGSGGNAGATEVSGGVEDPPLPGSGVQSTYLESGGQVIWTSGLAFRVSAGVAFIDGAEVNFTEQTITLDAADGSNPRIDVIAVNSAGTVVKVSGTAAASPSLPTIDPGSQLQLGFVTVAAAATSPTVTDTLLYAENVGAAVEWNCTDVGTGFVCNGATNTHAGTVDIIGTAVPSGDYIQLELGSGTFDPNTSRLLYCYVRPTATWGTGSGLQFTLRQSGIQRGIVVTLNRSGSYGFNSSTIAYQLVAIPVTNFAVPSGSLINQVRIAKFGSNSVGVSIDDCSFQANGSSSQPIGITQTQADARYQKLPVPLGIVIDGGGSAITTGVKGFIYVAAQCIVTKWTLLSTDASATAGAQVIDVWVDSYTNFPPTDADSITAAAPPTITATTTKGQSSTLTSWLPTIPAGSVVGFNVDSNTTLTRTQLTLECQ